MYPWLPQTSVGSLAVEEMRNCLAQILLHPQFKCCYFTQYAQVAGGLTLEFLIISNRIHRLVEGNVRLHVCGLACGSHGSSGDLRLSSCFCTVVVIH